MGINEDKRRQMEEMARKRRAERNREREAGSESTSNFFKQKLEEFNEAGIAEVERKKADGTYVAHTLGELRNDPSYAEKVRSSKGFAAFESGQRGFVDGMSFGLAGKALKKYGNQDLEEAYEENKNEAVAFVGELAGGALTVGGATKAVAGKAAGKLAVKEGAGSVAKFAEGRLVKKATESSAKTLLKRGARLSAMRAMTGQLFRSDAKVMPNQEYITECRNLPLAAKQQELLGLSTFIQNQMQNVQTMINERGYYTGTPVADASISK